MEVLSKSNAGRSWRRKRDKYCCLQGLTDLLLINSLAVGGTLYTRIDTGREASYADDLNVILEFPAFSWWLAMRDADGGLSSGPPHSL